MTLSRRRWLTSWKNPNVKSVLIDRLKAESAGKPIKITNSRIIKAHYDFWHFHMNQKNKFESLLYHPHLTTSDNERLVEMFAEHQVKKTKYAFLGTAFCYFIYHVGLKERYTFYRLVRKRPNIVLEGSRRFLKWFFLPMLTFNMVYLALDYGMKDLFVYNIKKEGFYDRYHLNFLLDKPAY